MESISSCNVCGSGSLEVVDAGWNLCRCSFCGFVFDSPRPTLDELVTFYSSPDKYDSWLDQEADRELMWKRRLKLILPYRSLGSILDIGTGIGQFLHVAHPYFTEVRGTEVSESAVKIAKEKYGLDIARGVVEELDFADMSFDNVTLFHVLEHVPDPARLIETCRRLLTDRGTLVIAVPNDILAWTSLIKRIGKLLRIPAFSKFSPVMGISKAGTSREIHLSHFTPGVLRRLLETHGFSIVFDSLDPYYAARGFREFLHSVHYSFHLSLHRLFATNRYPSIMMVARKQVAANTP